MQLPEEGKGHATHGHLVVGVGEEDAHLHTSIASTSTTSTAANSRKQQQHTSVPPSPALGRRRWMVVAALSLAAFVVVTSAPTRSIDRALPTPSSASARHESASVKYSIGGANASVQPLLVAPTVRSSDNEMVAQSGVAEAATSAAALESITATSGSNGGNGDDANATPSGVSTSEIRTHAAPTVASFGLGFEGTTCGVAYGLAIGLGHYDVRRRYPIGRAGCGWFTSGRFGGGVGGELLPQRERHGEEAFPVQSFLNQSLMAKDKRRPFRLSEASLVSVFNAMAARAEVSGGSFASGMGSAAYGGEGNGDDVDICHTAAAFGGPLAPSTLTFSGIGGHATLQSLACPFAYAPFGAPLAAALHHHAARVGSAEGRRGIVVSGDSMMRQLFNHIVASVRGYDKNIDYPAECDVLYTVGPEGDNYTVLSGPSAGHRNGSGGDGMSRQCHSRLDRAEGEAAAEAEERAETVRRQLRHWFAGYDGSDGFAVGDGPKGAERSLFAVLFLWEPSSSPTLTPPNANEKISPPAARLATFTNLSLVIAGLGATADLSAVTAFSDAAAQNLRAHPLQRLIYVTLPWRLRPRLKGPPHEDPRNRHMHQWALQSGPQFTKKTQQLGGGHTLRRTFLATILDFAAIADASVIASARIVPQPQQQSSGHQYAVKGTTNLLFKCPATMLGDGSTEVGCRDPMNEALTQWLLQLLVRL